MQIYLLSNDLSCYDAFRYYFEKESDALPVYADFSDFMRTYSVECVVSPANSFGLMDGGYDEAITEHYGDALQKRVQEYILAHYYGEQPVGTSFIIDAGVKGQKLIHTPSMRTPSVIKEVRVVYQCMRTTLMCAIENGISSIVIPAFGAATGGVPAMTVAYYMKKAYDQIKNPPREITWQTIERF